MFDQKRKKRPSQCLCRLGIQVNNYHHCCSSPINLNFLLDQIYIVEYLNQFSWCPPIRDMRRNFLNSFLYVFQRWRFRDFITIMLPILFLTWRIVHCAIAFLCLINSSMNCECWALLKAVLGPWLLESSCQCCMFVWHSSTLGNERSSVKCLEHKVENSVQSALFNFQREDCEAIPWNVAKTG